MRPLDLAVAEHGEHHRRVGRGDRRAEQPGGHPADAERAVGEEVTRPAVAKVPEHAEQRDRDGRVAEAPQADRRAAVEEDHDERDRPRPLDRVDRKRRAAERGPRRTRRRRAAARRAGSGRRAHRRPGSKTPYFSLIQGIIRQETLPCRCGGSPHPALRPDPRPRRRLRPARRAGDGVLELRAVDATKATIHGQGRGIWGQIDKGKLKVTDSEPGRQHAPRQVSGAERSGRRAIRTSRTTPAGTSTSASPR